VVMQREGNSQNYYQTKRRKTETGNGRKSTESGKRHEIGTFPGDKKNYVKGGLLVLRVTRSNKKK